MNNNGIFAEGWDMNEPSALRPGGPCHSGAVRRHDLDSLVRDYGSELVSIPAFADLFDLSAAALRSHIKRSEKAAGSEGAPVRPFPAAVSGGSSPSFLLGELIGWVHDAGLRVHLDHEVLAQWAVERSAGRCAGTHGADATFRLVAATALLLADGWLPEDAAAPGAGSYMTQLHTRARAIPPAAPRRFVLEWSALPPDFQPDPDPVSDPEVMDRLLEPTPSAAMMAPDDPANIVVAELARAWTQYAGKRTREYFIELVEDQVALQIGRTPTGRPRTPDLETRLLVALADLEPGHIVLDPAIGEGAAALAAHAATVDPKGRQRIGIVGREIDERTWCYTKMRFGLRGIAHALGTPCDDALDPAALPGRYERVIADPGVNSRQVRRWMERVLDLVTEDGIAVAQFAGADTIPPRERSGAWDALSPHVVALVLSPSQPGAPRGTGTFVIRPGSNAPILLAQVQAGGSSGADETRLDAAIATVSALVRRHCAEPSSVKRHWDGDVYIRSLDALTLDAFGPLDWDDTKVLRVAIERRYAADETPEEGGTLAKSDRSQAGPETEVVDAEDAAVLDDARRAVRLLRWLTDLDVTLDPAPLALPPRQRAGFAAETTDEIQVALKRLEKRLYRKPRRGKLS